MSSEHQEVLWQIFVFLILAYACFTAIFLYLCHRVLKCCDNILEKLERLLAYK